MGHVWDDGGRAACGFVGLTGDCVPRAIAIATGIRYRDVYEKLGKQCAKSPRLGVDTETAAAFLRERGWDRTMGLERPFEPDDLPMGVVIVHIAKWNGRSPHFCTMVDRVIHDTWDPSDDEYTIKSYWTSASATFEQSSHENRKNATSESQDLTQSEFEKILNRLRKLDRTASNGASTEAEKHNALRMMQSLMLRHNLTRDDIEDEGNVENVQFARIACPVNGRRACAWEKNLATYVTEYIIPTTQWFIAPRGSRTLFWFYGPRADVQNAIALFREMLLTIATSAHLQFRGHTRGSGASYAEGYVEGLPRSTAESEPHPEQILSEQALIRSRTLILHSAANHWLDFECNIQLMRSSGSGRGQFDEAAASQGRLHGSKHEIVVPSAQLRIGSNKG
jgi:hypothetical protein